MADTVQITMPQMGESVSEGTVLTWHKQEGDWVEKDETIVEISTDKVDAEVPSPVPGQAGQDPRAGGRDRRGRPGARRARARRGARGDGAGPEEGAHHRRRRLRTTEASRPPTAAPRRPHRRPPGDAPSTPVARRVAAAHGIDLERGEWLRARAERS